MKVLVEDRRVLVEDRRQLCGKKRSLEKEYHARLKEVGEDSRTLKIKLTEENRLLRKSYNAELRNEDFLRQDLSNLGRSLCVTMTRLPDSRETTIN